MLPIINGFFIGNSSSGLLQIQQMPNWRLIDIAAIVRMVN
jgi:hypothetical protein